jgi:cysteine desulfurase
VNPVSVYLDYAATAKVRPEAVQAVLRALEIGANPSSVHADGRKARAVIEDARARVAALVAARPENLVFTSGGAEADALAIESAALLADITGLIVGATEHDAVLETAKACAQATGKPLELWPVDGHGVADLDWLADRLARWTTGRPFVALMAANNETGVIQPVARASALVRAAGGWLHVDAVQAAGKIALNLDGLGADTLALSAHKLGGPQGSGALAFVARATLSRRLHGGGQERGRRAGTENLSGIAGFGAAAEAALRDLPGVAARATWRDAAAETLKASGAIVAGEGAPRLADVLCLAAPDWSSELQVMALDLDGVRVSAGAACSSGKVKASRVLEAMGYGALAANALRVSAGWASTPEDWTYFVEAWVRSCDRQRARKRSAA